MTKHAPEQIIPKLRAAEVDLAGGLTVGQVCQKLGISEQTLHRWRARYGGMKAEDARRLKELEVENERLRRPDDHRGRPNRPGQPAGPGAAVGADRRPRGLPVQAVLLRPEAVDTRMQGRAGRPPEGRHR